MPGGVVKRGGVVCRGGAVERGGPIETGRIVKKGRFVNRGGPTRKSRRSWLVACALATPLTLEAPVDKRCWRMRGGGARETTTNEETTIKDETTIDDKTTNDKMTMR